MFMNDIPRLITSISSLNLNQHSLFMKISVSVLWVTCFIGRSISTQRCVSPWGHFFWVEAPNQFGSLFPLLRSFPAVLKVPSPSKLFSTFDFIFHLASTRERSEGKPSFCLDDALLYKHLPSSSLYLCLCFFFFFFAVCDVRAALSSSCQAGETDDDVGKWKRRRQPWRMSLRLRSGEGFTLQYFVVT